ncbi:MAG: outer membrane protein assembly factor BamD [Lentisphaeria bacterium]|nr:outer membrane protein assembly factor BamD [Lentisphaeria bacterium]
MIFRKTILAALLTVVCVSLAAGDKEAEAAYQRGYELYQNGKYYEALKEFEEAGLEAVSPVIKANSLKARIASCFMSKLLYREFNAIEELLERFPEYADFSTLADREYEIAEAYFRGEREPAYWALRWVPWLSDKDRSKEIFEKAIARAPYAKQAAKARLRLAYIADQEGKVKDSLVQLRKLLAAYPESPEAKYALLSLGEGLVSLSRRGDGDGSYAREALEVLTLFKKRYPAAGEMPQVERMLLHLRDYQAERLYQIAEYYEKSERKETAGRYLAQIIQKYPNSRSAEKAEKQMAELDKSYTPDGFRPQSPSRLPKYKMFNMPAEAEKILITPQESGNKYLFPIEDLYPRPPEVSKSVEKIPVSKSATEVKK